MSNKTLPLTGAISAYYMAHGFREAGVLAELRAETAKLGGDANMQIAPEQGAFMGMVAAMMNAVSILEIGTFTGYSSLAMVLASHAQMTCVDVSETFTAMAREHWAKAGVADKISLRLDGGAAAIAALLAQGNAGSFDLCFIDADKTSYDIYYEGTLKLVRKGGVVMIDNVLWGGDVADPDKRDADTVALRALNEKIKVDVRVEMVMVPIGDGLTMVRKV
jgi:predicted O-methyltransferase YrrM